MLIWLLDWLATFTLVDPAAIEKITLRAALAAVSSFVLALTLGPRLIAWLKARFCEPNVSPSPYLRQLHHHKQWTPTMGGLFIITAVLASTLLLADLSNPFVLIALLTTLAFAILGAVDDLAKLHSHAEPHAGLRAPAKLFWQSGIAIVAAVLVYRLHDSAGRLDLVVPLARYSLHLGWWFIPLAAFVMVSASNAVNLTDGLDGLAGGCLLFSTVAMAVVVYIAGHAELAAYLDVAHVAQAGETVVVAGGLVGGLLGFLWFNCHPAQVFMGDTGSLPLGGLLGFFAICARQELVLVMVAGVFVVEAASVMIQVGSYKALGRRVFRCAPLHHHFQFLGWPENRIVVRFWIAAALCALCGVASLKWNLHEHPDEYGRHHSPVAGAVSPNL